jgi:hypothetical protein
MSPAGDDKQSTAVAPGVCTRKRRRPAAKTEPTGGKVGAYKLGNARLLWGSVDIHSLLSWLCQPPNHYFYRATNEHARLSKLISNIRDSQVFFGLAPLVAV